MAIVKSFGGLLKPLLFMGGEFLAMVGVLGAMKLAMVSGQLVMKGFRASMVGLGAAAGIAIGAVAGLLGAMRELNVAKMQPLFMKANGGKNVRGATGAQATMQQFYGDPQLAGFGEEALSGAMKSQLQAGGQADGAFRGQLTRYGDFSGGDPKALQAISSAMSTAQFKGTGKMKGKITGDTYAELKKSAPGMAEAFEEMAGGADKAEAAAAAGKISFDAFNTAIMEGKLKALQPYNGALAAINNTVIMKLKANLAGLKEQITSVGLGSFKELYGKDSPYGATGGPGGGRSIVDAIRESIDKLGTSLKISLAAVAPIIQKTMPGMIDGMAKPFAFLNEKLVGLIVRGMNSLDTFGDSFNRWIGIVRNAFTQAAAYIAPFAAAWDTVWNSLLKPIVSGVGGIFLGWLGSMTGQVEKGATVFGQWGINITGIFESLQKLGKSLNHFKDIMGPIISSLLRFVNVVLKILDIPGAAWVIGWGIGIKLAVSLMFKFQVSIMKAVAALKLLNMENMKAKMMPPVSGSAFPGRSPAVPPSTGGFKGMMAGGNPAMGAAGMAGGMVATMVGGYVSSRSDKTSGAGQGLGGALSGAGTGAMIGTMIAPGIGTAIGAALGGIAGGTMGVMNARKAQSQQKKDDEGKITDKIFNGREPQTLRAVANAEKRAKKYQAVTLKINKLTTKINNGDYYTEVERQALEKKRDALENKIGIESGTGAMTGITKVLKGIGKQAAYAKANAKLGALVGVGADELAGWADRNGIKLSKTMLKLADLQKLAGYAPGMSESERRSIAATRLGNTLNQSNNTKVAAAQAGIDAVNTRTSYYQVARGSMSADQRTVETGKLGSAIATRQSARYSAGAYGKGPDSFAKMIKETIAGLKNEVVLAQGAGIKGDNLTTLTSMIDTQIGDLTKTLTDFSERSQADPNFLKSMSDQVKTYIAQAMPGELKTPKAQKEWIEKNKANLDKWLEAQGISKDSIASSSALIQQTLVTELDASGVVVSGRLRKAIFEGGEYAARLMRVAARGESVQDEIDRLRARDQRRADEAKAAVDAAALAKWNAALLQNAIAEALKSAGLGPPPPSGDTGTTRFNRTLQAHGALNNMTSGKRTITSGIRSTNLGSINSDHLTGRAYDLTGQNLGAYASNVKATGGFAEFHGTGGSRHLHVVPGAMGDTASPVGIGMGGPAGTVNNYNIVVNPPPGASPEAIANEVMNRIAVRQRDSLERR